MIHKPEILFLYEPTTGIDVASARQLRQLIANLNRDESFAWACLC
jgi:ABC-2 type transport system ATP-binding protein